MQAGKELRVSAATVINYEHDYQTMMQGAAPELGSVSNALMVKEELLKRVSQLIRDTCTPIQYIASLSREMRELTGWTAPKQLEVNDSRVVKPIGELLDRWAAQRKVAGGTPQVDLHKKSLGGQLDTTKFGKGESLSPLVSTASTPYQNKAKADLNVTLKSFSDNDLEIDENEEHPTSQVPAGTSRDSDT